MTNEAHAFLVNDARQIWEAGLAAVDSERLVANVVSVDANALRIGTLHYPRSSIRRVVVIGAGKAGVGMASGVAEALRHDSVPSDWVGGWVNVPADSLQEFVTRRATDCPNGIHLHAGRPAGCNEPTATGELGARRILELVSQADPEDLVICLISGGGSALLPVPVEGITLADKLAVTKLLSGAGADIHELNTVRKQLSAIKGGKLRQACRARRMVTLTISDVLGDPLDVIASGPTERNATTAADALRVLERRVRSATDVPRGVWDYLKQQQALLEREDDRDEGPEEYHHLVIANNQTAVDAAARKAKSLGYRVQCLATELHEPHAEVVGKRLMALADELDSERQCIVSGGEPTVELAPPEQRGLGGRNQQLVLAALHQWQQQHDASETLPWVLLAGGTDGEDGPTDAAGAVCSNDVAMRARAAGLDPATFLSRNDAYTFFQMCHGLVVTGPTHTNVCDLRVVVK